MIEASDARSSATTEALRAHLSAASSWPGSAFACVISAAATRLPSGVF